MKPVVHPVRAAMKAALFTAVALLVAGGVLAAQEPAAVEVRTDPPIEQMVREAGRAFTRQTGIPVNVSTGGGTKSGSADVWLTANAPRLAELRKLRRLVGGYNREIFKDQLVLISRNSLELEVEDVFMLLKPEVKVIALPPAESATGKAVRDFLEAQGVWDRIQDKIRRVKDDGEMEGLLAVLEADVALVSRTLARRQNAYHMIQDVPKEHFAPRVYTLAVDAKAPHPEEARAFFEHTVRKATLKHYWQGGLLPP